MQNRRPGGIPAKKRGRYFGRTATACGYVRRGKHRRSCRLHLLSRKINYRRFVPFMIFLITGIVSLSLLVDYAIDASKRRNESEQLAQAYADTFVQTQAATAAPAEEEVPVESPDTTQNAEIAIPLSLRTLSGSIPQKAMQLYRQNNDLVGWLYIKGIVSLPVVYRDNEYYLTHGFDGKKDSGGTLFLDENHPLKESTQNLLIHGHNMHDSSMFGILSHYNKISIVKGHAFARFSTMYAPEDYVIFAVLKVPSDVNNPRFFNYIGKPEFKSAADFDAYVGSIRERSLFEIPVDVQASDAILSLATCMDDDRLVVYFRRIRDSEDKQTLQAQVDMSKKR